MKFKHSNQKFVVVVTGGGSLFLSQILTEGGASHYLLHAEVPYDQKSLEQFVGGVRESFCSESTARQIAVSAEIKGKALGYPNVIGIGATCSLSKGPEEREGRAHKIFVAAKQGGNCVSIEWEHTNQKYSRDEEEVIAANLIKQVSEIFAEYVSEKSHGGTYADLASRFRSVGVGATDYQIKVNLPSQICVNAVDTIERFGNDFALLDVAPIYQGKDTVCIYPGSFNPFHDGHAEIYNKCRELFGDKNCYFEISISNFDKPNIDPIELSNRVEGLRKMTKLNQIVVSRCLRFWQKAEMTKYGVFAGKKIVFAVGSDTFERLERDKHIPDAEFLVFPRNGKKIIDFESGNGILHQVIHKASYDLEKESNISSSEIRKQKYKNE